MFSLHNFYTEIIWNTDNPKSSKYIKSNKSNKNNKSNKSSKSSKSNKHKILLEYNLYGKSTYTVLQNILVNKKKKFSITNRNYNLQNLIVCPTWRINFWKDHSQNKNFNKISTRNDLNNLETILKKKNFLLVFSYNMFSELEKYLYINFNLTIIDYFIDDKFNYNILSNIKSQTKWLILNFYEKIVENEKMLEKLLVNYLTKNKNTNINWNEICYKNNNKIPFTVQIKDIMLDFNENESQGYREYIAKFKNIYVKNNISFENDDYLQKFCCYPQKNFCINMFTLAETSLKSQQLIKGLGNYKHTFLRDIQILHNFPETNMECNICLGKINKDNIGITQCGHIFCHTCIYDSVNYKKECPRCRNKIDRENIYLSNLDHTHTNTNHISNSNIKEQVDNLGTKISNLIKLVIRLNQNIIIVSNYDDNLIKIQNILEQLHFKSSIVKKNFPSLVKESGKKIYLMNYKYNFYKLDKITKVSNIIFNEPYYSESKIDKKQKYTNLFSIFNNPDVYNLIIKNTIEETIYLENNHIINNLIDTDVDVLDI